MLNLEDIPGPDLQAGRLLLGLSVGQLGERLDLSRALLLCLESGAGVLREPRGRIVEYLTRYGVRFEAAGIVHLANGDRAPTAAAVGVITGPRLKRARLALGMHEMTLASRAIVSPAQVRAVEALAKPLDRKSSAAAAVYAMFTVLERCGFRFDRDARRDKAIPS